MSPRERGICPALSAEAGGPETRIVALRLFVLIGDFSSLRQHPREVALMIVSVEKVPQLMLVAL